LELFDVLYGLAMLYLNEERYRVKIHISKLLDVIVF